MNDWRSIGGLFAIKDCPGPLSVTHFVLVLADVAHHAGTSDEIVYILVDLSGKGHLRTRLLHVRVVPCEDLCSVISDCAQSSTQSDLPHRG